MSKTRATFCNSAWSDRLWKDGVYSILFDRPYRKVCDKFCDSMHSCEIQHSISFKKIGVDRQRSVHN